MDTVDKSTRRRIMQSIKSKNTQPEQILGRALRRYDRRLSRHVKTIPGKPDFVARYLKVAILVEGCFWHGCPIHYKTPKTNKRFWINKVSQNIARDNRNRKKLYRLGWTVVRVWEHALRKRRLDETVSKINEVLCRRERSGRRVRSLTVT